MKFPFLKAGLIVFMLLGYGQLALADLHRNLFIFGDSLTDTGNTYNHTSGLPIPIPHGSRYFRGRFTNGPNTADYLWDLIGDSSEVQSVTTFITENPDLTLPPRIALDFAFGGSETGFNSFPAPSLNITGLLSQVGMFRVLKTDNVPMLDGIALVWSGANDYIFHQDASPEKVVSQIEKAIINLYNAGISTFIVPNLPNLGKTPFAHIIDQQYPGVIDLFTEKTTQHNLLLKNSIQRLRFLPFINIRAVDIYAVADELITPDTIVPGPASGCLYSPAMTEENCGTPVDFGLGEGIVYWDEVHPTTEIHKAFARAMYKALRHF